MADSLRYYRATFAELAPERGAVVALADQDRELSRDADLMTLDGFLARVVTMQSAEAPKQP
jgi:hypothetical protein